MSLRAPLLAAIVSVSALALGGCTAPRDALGTPTSRCFKVLPEARTAMHGKGRFTGVRYVTMASLARAIERYAPRAVDVPIGAARSAAAVCVVAYSGSFESAKLARGWPSDASSGSLALVVIRANNARVLATVVLARAPIRLTRLDGFDS